MSYYGYPNAGAYNANYQAYAAYAAAGGPSYNQYQAAYNAAAYSAMQQSTGQQTSSQNQNKTSSISQPAQRYDFNTQQQQQANKAAAAAAASSAAFYASAYASNVFKGQAANAKWPGQTGLGIMPPLTTTPGQLTGTGKKGNQFKQRRPGAQVQMFYCEVCKISCAGPQTYKEHLDGQKHKKREALAKTSEKKAAEAGLGTTGAIGTATEETNNTATTTTAQNRNQNRFTRNQNVIQCQLCDVACTGRDAYAAHIRGSKHQKTLKLHQKLGKPIPPELVNQPTPVPPPPKQVAPPAAPSGTVTISAPPKVNFLPGTTSTTSTIAPMAPSIEVPATTQNEDLDNDTSNNEPIGREYIETRMEGKILTFYCKLCDCKFNDPNAKDMHTKGKRHRLAYKKKVDPNLKIDVKSSLRTRNTGRMPKSSNLKEKQPGDSTAMNTSASSLSGAPVSGGIKPLMSSSEGGQGPQSLQSLMSQSIKPVSIMNLNQFNYQQNQQKMQQSRHESFDDRHIVSKHNSIYPTQDEINAIQEIVTSTEKALKLVSDQIAEEDSLKGPAKSEPMDSTQTGSQPTQSQTNDSNSYTNDQDGESNKERALKGVMRVGLLAKGLLLRGDTDVKLIVICSNKPTKALLERVHQILLQKIEVVSPEIKYSVILDKEAETIMIVRLTINEVQPLITCRVLLTSPSVREQINNTNASTNNDTSNSSVNEQSEDLLDKQKCLDSLAYLRHAKWFQARASQVPHCIVIIRILRDLCRRNAVWAPFSEWALELLVERSLSSSNQQLSPGEALRRVLECVSSGALLSTGCGLADPCEKEPIDVTESLTPQQREDITSSAQMALRLMAFKQIYKVLGIECIVHPLNTRFAKKRHLEPADEAENPIEEKKEKKEDENGVENLNGTSENADDVSMKQEPSA